MPSDSPTPMVSATQFQAGPFADLVRSYSAQALTDVLVQATRACETETGRRLAPFTLTETHRASAVDPDEYADSANLPLDMLGSLGRSYASAIGASSLVRRIWVNEYAPLYQDMWTYSGVTVTITRSYGGNQPVGPAQILQGPDPDTGHLWFKIGLFLPVGSMVNVTYSGGYTTMPADLVRACQYMAASIVARELDPMSQQHGHSPDALTAEAVGWLSPYLRG